MTSPPEAPADEVSAALAVARPALPALADLLDAHAAPLPAILALDEATFRAFAAEVARLRRIALGGRLVVGAYLHQRRASFPRGEWTPWVAALAQELDVGTETLGRWMLLAEKHFGLGLARSAKPSLRGPRPGVPAPNAGRPPAPKAPPTPSRRRQTRPDGGDAGGRAGSKPAGEGFDSPAPPPAERREVCPRCHGEGTIPVPVSGRNAPDTSAQTCAHPKRKQLGYMTLCADCGTNLSGR